MCSDTATLAHLVSRLQNKAGCKQGYNLSLSNPRKLTGDQNKGLALTQSSNQALEPDTINISLAVSLG